MKYEITKEQLQELAKGNAKVERWFPEAFETKLEVGKWYNMGESIINWQGELSKSYGISNCGYWYESGWFTHILLNVKPATESEVFEALKKEAVKRGYTKGAKIKRFNGDIYEIDHSEIYHWTKPKETLSIGNGDVNIYLDGKWAEIIKEKTLSKSEAEAKLNELINDGYAYKIG